MPEAVVKFLQGLVGGTKDGASDGGEATDHVHDAKIDKASKPNTIHKSKSPSKLTATPAATFELTPMSQIIAQSYKDITTLRKIQATNPPSPNLKQVDFNKVEENLKRFEQMYSQFLRYGSKYGDAVDEVHLVAMWCKDGDIDRKNVAVPEGIKNEAAPDCGL